MSDSIFSNMTPKARDALLNWRAWCHRGESVVPRNFLREVDRGEARRDVIEGWAVSVEAIYRRELASNPSRALVIAHEVFGGAPGTHKARGVSRRQVIEWLTVFGREVDAIDPFAVEPGKLLAAPPMKLYPEYRRGYGRERDPEPRWTVVTA